MAPFIMFVTLGTTMFFITNSSASSKIKPITNIKPSIHFDDLELKCLCDLNELRQQFPQKLRSKWTKCLGLGRLYLPSIIGSDRHRRRMALDEYTLKRLRLFLTTNDESLNVFCRLASNWKSCSYHLRQVHCLQSNQDAILLAKNPKYSPLYHNRQLANFKLNSKKYLIVSEREDNIENMSELYQIRCEHIRMSSYYMNGRGGGSALDSSLLNRYNQHLFEDYQYPDEKEDEDHRQEEL